MSKIFYLKEEDNKREDSIQNYNKIFESYTDNIPTLEEALKEMYILSKLQKIKAIDLTNDIIYKCNNKMENRMKEINKEYPNITKEDAVNICSYTCEADDTDYSPYKILNKNLISENRENGIKIVSKYFFILLKSLRKLPRYYPDKNNGYLYRCITKHINYMIDPFNKKTIPYIMGEKKTFWGFTSATTDIISSYEFLGDKKDLKSGTIFTLYGDIWGYDITLFNYYEENEILLEPERKFLVTQIFPPVNDIIHVRCEFEESPLVLNKDSKKSEHLQLKKAKTYSPQQIIERISNLEIKQEDNKNKCKNGKSHQISNTTGKCRICNIIGCENDLIQHNISNITGKCRFCQIIGCEKNLINHNFNKITGKCNFCQIIGCQKGLIEHNFNKTSGKCNFCQIIGCKNDLIGHNFNKYNGKCTYCQIIGCEKGLYEHNFNKHSGKCEYCQILGCKKGLYEHNFNKYSGKCNYCGQINQNNF